MGGACVVYDFIGPVIEVPEVGVGVKDLLRQPRLVLRQHLLVVLGDHPVVAHDAGRVWPEIVNAANADRVGAAEEAEEVGALLREELEGEGVDLITSEQREASGLGGGGALDWKRKRPVSLTAQGPGLPRRPCKQSWVDWLCTCSSSGRSRPPASGRAGQPTLRRV